MTYFENIIKTRRRFMHYFEKENYPNCILYGQKLIGIYKKNGDTENIDYADDLYNLGYVFQALGGYKQAKRYYIESVKTVRKITGKSVRYEDGLNNLAICCAKLGEYERAIHYFEKTAKISQKQYGKNSKEHLNCVYNIANVYYDMEEYEESILKHKNTLSVRKMDNDRINTLNRIGYAYEGLRNYDSAIGFFKRALSDVEQVHGIESGQYLSNIYYLSGAYLKAGMYSDAVETYEDTAKRIKKQYSEKHPYFADVLNKLAESLTKNGEGEKSLKIRLKSLKIMKEQIGENHVYYANSLRNIAMLYKSMDKTDKAAELFLKSLNIKADIVGAGSIDYIRDVMILCGMFIEKYEYDRAIDILTETIELLKAEGGEYTEIIPEIIKIFDSIKDIKDVEAPNDSEEENINLIELLRTMEDKIYDERNDDETEE